MCTLVNVLVIGTLIGQLAQGLQKWVGWQEGGQDACCLKGTQGIGRECKCAGVGVGGCCSPGGKPCHECDKCGTGDTASNKCYLSAYCKKNSTGTASSGTTDYLWPTISCDSTKVHLLARILLGSVCLIWSGLSQLGFLTGGSDKRWKEKALTSETEGLGSFMAAMGYDLERLNGSGVPGKYCLG